MSKPTLVYIAFDSQDRKLVDMLRAHLDSLYFRSRWRKHVKKIMDEASDIEACMDDCDLIIVIDSASFRQQSPNYELKFAQSLDKPLVVLSLHQVVDESKSSKLIRLFNFSQPSHEEWQRVVASICEVIKESKREIPFGFLF